MKKSILIAALAALTFSFASCDKEEDPIINNGNNGEINTELRVKSASDLIGTEWTYTLSLTDFLDSTLANCIENADLNIVFGLNFDSAYAHLTFPAEVIGLNVVEDNGVVSINEISQMDYTYTYDPATLSGELSGGNLDDIELPFTYDATNDIITISLLLANEDDEDNPIPFSLILERVE